MRFPFLPALVIVGGCGIDPASHCERRQELWARAYADADQADAERVASTFIASCTKELSKPEARDELICRQQCLEKANTDAAPGSANAKDAYMEFSRCERGCLGGAAGPQK